MEPNPRTGAPKGEGGKGGREVGYSRLQESHPLGGATSSARSAIPALHHVLAPSTLSRLSEDGWDGMGWDAP